MVFIDGKKFACQACIKGHRSTNCSHTDRTLLEIGKKGRPPTQCTHCRELRRISKVHSKCTCGDKPSPSTRPPPIILPNGAHANHLIPSSDTIQLVNQILNPCSCSIGRQCVCSTPAHPTTGTRARRLNRSANDHPTSSSIHSPSISKLTRSGSCRPTSSNSLSSNLTTQAPTTRLLTSGPASILHPYSNPNDPTPPPPPFPSTNHLSNPPMPSSSTSSFTPAPLSFDPPSSINTPPALFAPKTAGTALCFCGIHCPCPGCVLHDPLGLKFRPGSDSQCPTSLRKSEGCIAGLDLPTVNELLNLSPIAESFPKLGTIPSSNHSGLSAHPPALPPLIQLPRVTLPTCNPSPPTSTSSSSSSSSSSLVLEKDLNPFTVDGIHPKSLRDSTSAFNLTSNPLGCCQAQSDPQGSSIPAHENRSSTIDGFDDLHGPSNRSPTINDLNQTKATAGCCASHLRLATRDSQDPSFLNPLFSRSIGSSLQPDLSLIDSSRDPIGGRHNTYGNSPDEAVNRSIELDSETWMADRDHPQPVQRPDHSASYPSSCCLPPPVHPSESNPSPSRQSYHSFSSTSSLSFSDLTPSSTTCPLPG